MISDNGLIDSLDVLAKKFEPINSTYFLFVDFIK